MAFDDTFQLLDAALDQGGAQTVSGTAVELGRTGLPKGAQLAVVVDNPGGTAGDSPNLSVNLQISRDNGSTYDTLATIDLGDPTDDFQGQVAVDIARAEAWQEYADANLQVRHQIVTAGSNNSNNVNADKLAVYITQGEVTRWGRKKSADTLFV